MTSILFYIRGPNTKENVTYVIYFYSSANVLLSHFEEVKNNFFVLLQFDLRVMYQRFSGFWRLVIVYRTEI